MDLLNDLMERRGGGKVHDTIVLVGSKYYYDVVDNYLLLFCSLYAHVSLSQVMLMSNNNLE